MPDLRLLPVVPEGAGPVQELGPNLLALLTERGVSLEPRPAGGRRDAHEDVRRRMETGLMALFRDTRSEQAFEALHRSARGALLSWIGQLLASRGQSADPLELLQDTFVNAYRYAKSFRDEGGNSFRGWARTIASNVVRRDSIRRPVVSLSALPAGLLEPEDERGGPECTLVRDEQEGALRRAWALLLLHYAAAFQKLSPRDQHALELIEVEGLGYREAAGRLGVGGSNMKMIMFRSRKRIRAHMQLAMVAGPREGEAPVRSQDACRSLGRVPSGPVHPDPGGQGGRSGRGGARSALARAAC